MDDEMITSVNGFIDELKKQISLFEDLKPQSNLFNDDFSFFSNVIKTHNFDINNLTVENIVEIPSDEIELIISKIGLGRNLTIHYLYNYTIMQEEYKSSKTKLSSNFFGSLLDLINNYIEEYNQISANRKDLKSSKVELYEKYIEIFSGNSQSIFTDMEGLKKIMSTLAIQPSDQWQILKYINSKNLELIGKCDEEINITKEVSDYINYYLDETDENVELIRDELGEKNVDVDLLPTLAETIAENLQISRNKCLGILASIVLNSLLEEYQEIIKEKVVDFAQVSHLRDMMRTVLNYRVTLDDSIVDEVKNIIFENQDFIMAHESENMKRLSECTVDELLSTEINYDEAIHLKTLPILKSMEETLNKLNSAQLGDNDYMLCCGLLEELVQAYNNLLSKTELKRII